jgi:hypothetical protein
MDYVCAHPDVWPAPKRAVHNNNDARQSAGGSPINLIANLVVGVCGLWLAGSGLYHYFHFRRLGAGC